MQNKLVFERSYNAPIAKVWKAITDKDQMKEWYFDLAEFRAEPGFEFSFYGGSEERQYLHKCRVIEANPVTKLSYTWEYDGIPGSSLVSWELEPTSKSTTKLTLTHTGVESFPKDNPDFAGSSFSAGWTEITGTSLTNFVETGMIERSVNIKAGIGKIWHVLCHPDNTWAAAFGTDTIVQTNWKQGSPIIWTDAKGDIGASGIILTRDENSKLEFQYYDDTKPAPGQAPGEYKEIFELTTDPGGSINLNLTIGPLSKKHLEPHGEMWTKAAELIKSYSENSDK